MTTTVAVIIHTEASEKSKSKSVGYNNNAGSSSALELSTSYSHNSLDALNATPHSDTIDIEFPLENTEISETGPLINHKLCNEYHCIREADTEHSTHNKISHTTSPSLSQCRYCYKAIGRKSSVSHCHCNGNLCKRCLMKEVVLTYTRSNNDIRCTVCRFPYEAKTEFKWKSRDCKEFLQNNMILCGLRNEEYLLDSLGGKLGYALVIIGIAIWIFSTAFVFAYPPYDLPPYLYYMIAVFDLMVGIATLWFIIKCRWLTSLFLSILYGCRCLYLLLGWIAVIDWMDVSDYDTIHINIMSYFISFSFIAFIILTACWVMDILHQIQDYKTKHRTLVIDGIRIDIDAINARCCREESDALND